VVAATEVDVDSEAVAVVEADLEVAEVRIETLFFAEYHEFYFCSIAGRGGGGGGWGNRDMGPPEEVC